MRCIAIDLGAKLGYCVFEDEKIIEVGAVNLPTASKAGSTLKRRYLVLKELIRDKKAEHSYYECTDWHLPGKPGEPFGARLAREKRNRQVQRALGRLEALVEAASTELGIESSPITVHEAKKALTKNGNASKDKVKKEVESVFGIVHSSQDAIDSVSVAVAVMAEKNPLWRMKVTRKLDF